MKNQKKSNYGEFQNVKLTDEEYEKLEKRLGQRACKLYIDKLDLYIEQFGKDKYKSHYATMLNWYRRDREKGAPRKTSSDISRAPSYNLEAKRRETLNNTEIKF